MRDPLNELRYLDLDTPDPWKIVPPDIVKTLVQAVLDLRDVVIWQDSIIEGLQHRMDELEAQK